MSSSPRTAPARTGPAKTAAAKTAAASTLDELVPGIEPFPYEAYPEDPARRSRNLAFPDSAAGEESGDSVAARETRVRLQGQQQGLAEARKTFDDQLVRERANVASALSGFTRERAVYFQQVEGEVVKLALSIAARILHREAQLDPLLLAGIVRVALEKIDGATGVRLRLHPQNAADWRRYLSTSLEAADQPEIVEDAAQSLDRCSLETSMGVAVLGLDVQLKEIELGLMDLLAVRPGAVS